MFRSAGPAARKKEKLTLTEFWLRCLRTRTPGHRTNAVAFSESVSRSLSQPVSKSAS
jgi:hypothetical protein